MSWQGISLKKANRLIWIFGLTKIPLLAICRPKIIAFDENQVVVKIRLGYFTKNHLGSMYFGAMAIGADLAGGLHAFFLGYTGKQSSGLVFKDFRADFLQRPYGDVFFKMTNGRAVLKQFEKSKQTGERITEQVMVTAYAEKDGVETPVAVFELGLSLKVR